LVAAPDGKTSQMNDEAMDEVLINGARFRNEGTIPPQSGMEEGCVGSPEVLVEERCGCHEVVRRRVFCNVEN